MPPASWSFTWHPPAISSSALYLSLLSWTQGLCFIHLVPPHILPSLITAFDHMITGITWFFSPLSFYWLQLPDVLELMTNDPPHPHIMNSQEKYHLSRYDIPSRNNSVSHVYWVFSNIKLVAFSAAHAWCRWLSLSRVSFTSGSFQSSEQEPRDWHYYSIQLTDWGNWGPEWKNGWAKPL